MNMRIEDSNLGEFIKEVHISENGHYYFFDDFIIAEINKGVTYTWESAKDIIDAAYEYYGDAISICYITNRVNEYSVSPADWLKFFKSEHSLNGYAIVSITERGWLNAIIEKMFLSTKVKRFTDLYEAVDWAKSVNKRVNLERSKVAAK